MNISLCRRIFFANFPQKSVCNIDRRSKRTNPTAEKSADNNRQRDDYQAYPESRIQALARNRGHNSVQWTDLQEEINRNKTTHRVCCINEKPIKKEKKGDLN